MFTYSRWLRLTLPTRAAIAHELGIAKVGSTHVADNQVVADGYKVEDVEAALERIGEEEFQLMVDKIERPQMIAAVPEIKAEMIAPEQAVTTGLSIANDLVSPPIVTTTTYTESKPPKKRGRPSKKK